jgi:hypothetical protein
MLEIAKSAERRQDGWCSCVTDMQLDLAADSPCPGIVFGPITAARSWSRPTTRTCSLATQVLNSRPAGDPRSRAELRASDRVGSRRTGDPSPRPRVEGTRAHSSTHSAALRFPLKSIGPIEFSAAAAAKVHGGCLSAATRLLIDVLLVGTAHSDFPSNSCRRGFAESEILLKDRTNQRIPYEQVSLKRHTHMDGVCCARNLECPGYV